ncbi:hypothetical protein [Subtercola boreus]|uniref:hypothetical protein n=1 Tax=Subtercola boreus TaxID=120213 RepID=UPI00115179EE|nr:hypothetical protein [Subtercola boreus]
MPAHNQQLFPVVDRWFLAFIALEVVTFPLIPLLPLVVAAAGIATPLRRSRWRLSVLFSVGLVLSLIVAAPVILGLLDIQLVQNGPAHTIPDG